MPRFDEGVEITKLEYADILLTGNPGEYSKILAQNILVEDITRDSLQTLITNSRLVRGKLYRITNAVGSTLSIIVQALTANTLGDISYNSATGDIYTYSISNDTGSVGLNLGENGLNTGFVTYDTTPTNTPTSQATTYWDSTEETLALIMNGVTQRVGLDTFFNAKNSTGTSIPKGTAVRFAGTDGNSGNLLIAPMLADGTYPSVYYMGVTAEAIDNGQFGKVMSLGKLRTNTNAYVDGDVLYVSSTVAGGFQTTAPLAPNNIIIAAAVVNAANNGVLEVRATLGSNINNDEGVKITTPLTGQLLQLQSNGLWENKTKAQILGGTSTQFVKGDGTLDSNTYLTSSTGVTTVAGTSNQVLVNGGTSAVSGAVTLTLPQSIGTTSTPQFSKLALGSSSLIANRVMPLATAITGNSSSLGVDFYGSINSDVTTSAVVFRSNSSTGAAVFTLTDLVHFQASPATVGVGSAITNQSGFEVASNLIGATNNYGFRGRIGNAANRWNIYMDGTAANYFNGNVQIGSTTPTAGAEKLQVTGTASISSTLLVGGAVTTTSLVGYSVLSGATTLFSLGYSGGTILNRSTGTNLFLAENGSPQLRILTGGNVLIGGSIDGGEKLQVTGTARITGATAIGGALTGSSTAQFTKLGLGTSSLTGYNLRITTAVTGSTVSFGHSIESLVNSDVTDALINNSSVGTQSSVFTLNTLVHFRATQGTFGVGSTVTNQYGFFANSLLIGATNNFGFRGAIPSGTGRWNIYMDGTAANYMAGKLQVGSTTDGGELLQVTGTARITGATAIGSTLTVTGNILPQATATYDLGVTGTRWRDLFLSRNLEVGNIFDVYESNLTTAHRLRITADTNGAILNATRSSGNPSIMRFQLDGVEVGRFNSSNNFIVTNGATIGGTLAVTGALTGSSTAQFAKLGIGTSSLTGYNLRINQIATGATSFFNMLSQSQVQSDVTSLMAYYDTLATTQASVFTLTNLVHYRTDQSTIGATSSVTNQYGFFANSSLTGATNNFGFYGNIASATGRWNFYANGTAANYFNGDVLLGTTTAISSAKLVVTSTTQGFLPPRMTTAQRDAIASPVAGLVIYNTSTNKLNVYTTAWEAVTSA